MASNEYHFITHWRVLSTVAEVREIIADAAELPRWWPSVYLDVKLLEEGAPSGVGRSVDLYTKGWLPYTLRWQFTVTEVREDGITLEPRGDFLGRGIWTFVQHGDWTKVTYDWKVTAEKPLLRSLSGLLRPIFEANHRWAMARGEESLRLELARRHAKTPEQLALVPEPPPPTKVPVAPLAFGAAAIVGALTFRAMRRTK